MSNPFHKAQKSQAKARIGISGPAGAGKTYTALRLATALCQRVAVIDTEYGSASKYADEFAFDVLELTNFHPVEGYVRAIEAAAAAGYDGLVIDSASHEWEGPNGCKSLVDKFKPRYGGNAWAAWGDVTPLHNAFIEALHRAPMHLFVTFRSKMDYIQTEDSKGKKVIQKVGMNPLTRDGTEYELDIVGEMTLAHELVITKTRCKALTDQVFVKPGEELAAIIRAWLSDGAPVASVPAGPGHAAFDPAPGEARAAESAVLAEPCDQPADDLQKRQIGLMARATHRKAAALIGFVNATVGTAFETPDQLNRLTADQADRVLAALRAEVESRKASG